MYYSYADFYYLAAEERKVTLIFLSLHINN